MNTKNREQIIDLVERIRLSENAFVDVNFGQGLSAMLALKDSDESRFWVSEHFEEYGKQLEQIKKWVVPYIIPDDYLFFLEYYGGLAIEEKEFNFLINGCGPAAYTKYDDLMSEWGISIQQPGKYGFLHIASLESSNADAHYIYTFAIDLVGRLQKNAVFRFEDYTQSVTRTIEDLEKFADFWKLEASSFTQFLEIILLTQGRIFDWKSANSTP